MIGWPVFSLAFLGVWVWGGAWLVGILGIYALASFVFEG